MKNGFKNLFKVVATCVFEEGKKQTQCGQSTPATNGFTYVCNRKEGHRGLHVAIGDEDELLEIWGHGDHAEDDNKDIVKSLDLLASRIWQTNKGSVGCHVQDTRGLMCLRRSGHKGLHVATGGSMFGSAWEQKYE